MPAISPLLLMLPLLCLLATAAVIDARTRRIPNWITFALLLSGLLRPMVSPHGGNMTDAGLGFGLGFLILFVPFCLGVAGGGDVKMIAGLGAWLGPVGILVTVAIVYLVEMTYVLLVAARSGKLQATFKNAVLLVIELIHSRGLRDDESTEDAKPRFESLGKRLPYAVPTLIGAAVVIAWL